MPERGPLTMTANKIDEFFEKKGYPYQRKTWREVVTHLLRKPMYNPSAHLQVAGVDDDDGGEWGWLDDEVQE